MNPELPSSLSYPSLKSFLPLETGISLIIGIDTYTS